MSELLTIEGKIRTETGKSVARKIRKRGWIPGVVTKIDKGFSIELNPHKLGKVYQSAERTFLLDLAGDVQKMKIHEVQLDPVKRVPVHVDLLPL